MRWLRRRKPEKKRHWVLRTLLILFLLAVSAGGAGYYYLFEYTGDLTDGECKWLVFNCTGKPIDLDKPSHNVLKRTSYVRDKDGQIIYRFFEEIRDPIKLEEVPELLKNGFIAAEDKKFYRGIMWGYLNHPGIDPAAILRASVGNVAPYQVSAYLNFSRLSGASGIHQQYVRLIYEDEIPEFKTRERSLWRKIKEAKIAIQLAKRYPRDKILEDFLNIIYLGHGVNGLAEATQRHFGKDMRFNKLTLRDIAILASLNKSPYLYCPIFHKPDESKLNQEEYKKELAKEIIRIVRARERYNWVLKRVLEDRYITEQEYKNAYFSKDEPFEFEHLKIKPLNNPNFNYGSRLVKEFLMQQGFSDTELSYYGGFNIYTTFDTAIQKIATEEFEKHLALLNQEKRSPDRLNGAFVIIEIKTGNILAMSGGYDFNESQYNRVLAYRSPGSGIKPFVYAIALENFGYDFSTKACNTSFKMVGANGKIWEPGNFEEKNSRPMDCKRDLAEGIIYSLNLETLDIARKITMSPIVALMNNFGIWGNPGIVRDSQGAIWFKRPNYEIKGGLVPLLPTVIGASEVNLLELVNAYAVFFRGGIYMRPSLIREVKDADDKPVAEIEPSYQERVLSEETSNKIIALMRAVTKIGTAKISMRDIEQQVACKTGTSDGPRDVSMWCGTPDFVIGIRIGHDNYRVLELPEYMRKISGDAEMQVSGGWVVGPLARKMIDRIYAERQKSNFPLEVENNLRELLYHYEN